MSKVLLMILVASMCVSLIVASVDDSCKKHGAVCQRHDQCCPRMQCRTYINSPGDKRCQVHFTKDEIMKQREKILNRTDIDQ